MSDATASRNDRLSRAILVTALAATWLYQAVRQYFYVRDATPSLLTGDWLISYAGGFVRRGLFGSLLLSTELSASSTLYLLWLIQTALYAVVIGIAIRWSFGFESPARWMPLLLSPAFILFGLHDFSGTHRKEIIVFAALFVLAEAVRSRQRVRAAILFSTLLMGIGVYSHEANGLLVLPFILLILWALRDGSLSSKFAFVASGVLLTVAMSGLVATVIAPGTAEQQTAICNRLVERGFAEDFCLGPNQVIGDDVGNAVGGVFRGLILRGNAWLYLFPGAFALIPLWGVGWFRRNLTVLSLVIAPIAPLFIVALDWGRWMMFGVVILTVLTVVGAQREREVPRPMAPLVVFLFLTAWRLPHFGIVREDISNSDVFRAFFLILGGGA